MAPFELSCPEQWGIAPEKYVGNFRSSARFIGIGSDQEIKVNSRGCFTFR
jgi:hypothetical protein